MQEIEDKATKLVDVIKLSDSLITIDKTQYKIVENHDSGFNEERIEERYNNVLEKYDYIVGDWGYDQLRFKGFYEDNRRESTLDNRISHLEDYLLEYCNFGCAYFVLEKVKKAPLKKLHRSNNKSNGHKTNHKFRTRTNRLKKNTNNHTPKKKSNNSKHRVNKKVVTTATKKTFKIRKIGEKNK